jgi:hypothetical protein
MSSSQFEEGNWVVLLTHDGDQAEDEDGNEADETYSERQGLVVGDRYRVEDTSRRMNGVVTKILIVHNGEEFYHRVNKFKRFNPIVRNIPWL